MMGVFWAITLGGFCVKVSSHRGEGRSYSGRVAFGVDAQY